ncbi:unnamed protein product [Cuscuta campestris]|uniref:Uncharacterized protein n=1 Tax=Cuscuta campestris TaxID=132261 RepID=A0A484L9H2_9ASTE|nr:unnamed protein product [Cuscuta campestris]
MATAAAFNVEEVVEVLESLTRDAGKVQEETLRRILEENKETEYLQKWGLNGRTDPVSFKASVPLVLHMDLDPYIQRIADGDASPVLTSKPVTAMSMSSGTSQGKQKYIPFTEAMFKSSLFVLSTSFAYRNREFPIGEGKVLQFLYSSKKVQSSKGGLPAAPVSAHVFNRPEYSEMLKGMSTPSCSPSEVIHGPDFQESLYCHLLSALIFRHRIQFVASVFAHGIILALRRFEQVWEELCADIRTGVVSTARVSSPSVRAAMSKLLSEPDPQSADEIHRTCKRLMEKGWSGLIPELFPNAKYIHCIMTGTMQPYVKKMRHYAGETPLLSADYGASEGWVGLNVNPRDPPETATFAVVPNVAYFEFIPLKNNGSPDSDSATVGLTEVRVGEEYEIVMTNDTGMYRYRLGDIVKVHGFHNKTPLLRYVCRKNVLLNIDIDKNTEEDLQLSVEAAAAKLLSSSNNKTELHDFTSHIDKSAYPGHYVIFWELSGEATDDQVLQECCDCMDRSFADMGYVVSRKTKTIGPLELRVVRGGTFGKILSHYVGLGTAANQFKSPRFVAETNGAVLGILAHNLIKSFFSSAYD